jgi:hypothetical protein
MNYAIALLNDFLKEVIKNNTYCKTCELNHNGICFFAFECVANDFVHYMDNGMEE